VIKNKAKPKTSAKPSSPIRWWHVVVVALLIAALFFLLEKMKRSYQQEAAVKPAAVELPQTPVVGTYLQKAYTTVRAIPPKRRGQSPRKHLSGTLAIIVDDMGSSLQEARELLAINIPLTFSLIPGLPKVKGVAELAASARQEVMVHLPMEPQGYPERRLEANGLLVAHSENEITERTVALLNSVPQAKGANNHMGSRFSEHEEKMLPVLKVLQGRGLFFIDSMTTPRSKGAAIAESLGMRFAARNVFLDNEQDVSAIKKQLYAAAEMARKKGGVIAICHPHTATIVSLKETLPELQRAGITFVTVGELVR
jgi:polysaccharide deacetylase 2 family uncharacterized protein YibQ